MNLRTIKKYQRAPLVFGATLWFILGALSLSSCQTIEDAARAKIEEEIREAAPGQIPDEQPVDPSQIRLSTIIPGRSPSAGGVLIKITGFGFQENLQISFGDVLADQAQVFFQSATSIQVMAPPHTPGDVDIKILQNDESTTLEGAFEYYEEVSVIALIPGRAGTGGGDELLLEGRSLLDDSSVWFGDDVIATGHSTGDDNTGLVVIAPPLDFGVYDITVTNPNGSATLVAAYRPYEKVYVDRIEPFVGPLEGGIPVQVYGRGFVPGTRLRFGTQGAEALSDSSETTLNATLPAAVPFVEGVVTVEVDNENGLFKRPDAFVYIDTSDTSDRIIAVLPPASLIEGGGDIYIVGTGFEEGAEVLFGTTSATCEVEGANTISCIAPQNNEGDVQMVVTQGGHPLGDPFVFTYIDLRLDTIIPPEGARAGGTYVEISGNGLNVDTQIFIGDKEVSDLSIQSTSTATFKTPPGSVGSSTIRIEQAGIEVDATPLFTYFDPYKPYFWSWGGPIDNAVNITVQDAYDGSRIEDAWVIIGNDSETSLRGLTDSLGQVTLSREGLVGPLTITTAKNSFGSFSWVGSDARNLRMRLSPYPVPPPEPPPPPEGEGEGDPPEVQDPPPPATIRGTVFRIKDPYNYGDDLVMLTTSRDPSTWTLPEPGPNSVIVNNGPYELFAREGDLIVIALAGYLNEAGYFEPHAMGFHPFLYTELGEEYDNIDITIDTPVDGELRLLLDEPPFEENEEDFGPNTASANITFDFGYQGFFEYKQVHKAHSSSLYFPMPSRLPPALDGTVFDLVAGAYVGIDIDGDPLTPPALTVPISEVRLPGNIQTTGELTATPMISHAIFLSPESGQVIEGIENFTQLSFERQVEALPSFTYHNIVRYPDTGYTRQWEVLAESTITDFTPPILPPELFNDGLLPPAIYSLQTSQYFKHAADFNDLELYDVLYYWRSRSFANSSFEIGGAGEPQPEE